MVEQVVGTGHIFHPIAGISNNEPHATRREWRIEVGGGFEVAGIGR